MPQHEKQDNTKQSSKTIKYQFSNDYNPIYVNGAYGGVDSNGDIIANFYLERHPLPKKQTIYADGTIEDDPQDLKQTILRYVETGIVMNTKTAQQLADWLYQKIEQAKAICEKTPQKKGKNEKA
jgi:hypothetical protein